MATFSFNVTFIKLHLPQTAYFRTYVTKGNHRDLWVRPA